VLVAYLYLRFWDALSMTYTYMPGRTEGLQLLTTGPLSFNFWGVEVLLGAVLPIVVLLSTRLRRMPIVRMMALGFVVLGVIAYRWDTNLAGELVVMTYLPQEIAARYTSYVPSLIEMLTGAGIVAYGLLAFSLGARYLNVVDHTPAAEAEPHLEAILAAAD
jgi:molybdopterin-containing oxidoreductase family membrane subunit